MPEHQNPGEYKCRGICKILAGDVRRAAVHRFEYRRVVADVGAGCETEAADKPGGEVRQDVPEEICRDDDVELMGIDHHLHRHVVDDLVLGLDVLILRRDGARHVEKQAPRVLQYVRLVHRRHLFTPVPARVVVGIADNPLRARARHDADSLRGAPGRIDVVLDPRIEFLRVFPHDDKVDVPVPRGDPFERTRRAHVAVQIEFLPERDVDAAEPRPDGGRQGPFERDARAADRLDDVFRKGVLELVDCRHAGFDPLPLDIDTRRLYYAHGDVRDARPDAVAGYQGYCVHAPLSFKG